ncbi:MAG TPA: amidase [Rhizomicrobium sp.]|nr:amidase [Rhizomicrobium sp.]
MAGALHYRTLAATAEDIRSGALSSEEVTRHTLTRIQELEPRLHAFACVREESALAEAHAADTRRARGEALGSLHGVPLAVKDLCAMAGTKTGAGGFFRTQFSATDTATVVRRLQDAGAIIVGKTQLTEGAWGAHHPDITPPVNPWAADRWSGASSSGSGVAVAAGLAYGAIGTDTAGSIRFPSTANRLVGLKPTWGRVSRHGVFRLSDTLDHVGPMTRSVLDAALMFDAIAGPDPADPTSLDVPPPESAKAARQGSLKGVRIGLDPTYALDPVEPAVAASLKRVIAAIESAGAEIVDVRLPDVRENLLRLYRSAAVEAAISHAETYPSEAGTYSPGYRSFLELGHTASVLDYAAIQIWRREFRGGLARLFKTVDMLIAPSMPVEPPTLATFQAVASAPPEMVVALMVYTIPFNAAGIPTLTLPMDKTEAGVPLGFQLIGPDLSEARLLAAGAAYEQIASYATDHPAM